MDWDSLLKWAAEHKILVALAVLIAGGLGFGVSIKTPYVTKPEAIQSHESVGHLSQYKAIVSDLKDNRKWLSYYQSQIALYRAIEQDRPLRADEQAILDSLEREQPLIFESRERMMQQLEEFKPIPDPLAE